jgi:hypothetical protein
MLAGLEMQSRDTHQAVRFRGDLLPALDEIRSLLSPCQSRSCRQSETFPARNIHDQFYPSRTACSRLRVYPRSSAASIER